MACPPCDPLQVCLFGELRGVSTGSPAGRGPPEGAAEVIGADYSGREERPLQVGCRRPAGVASGLLAAGGRSVLWGQEDRGSLGTPCGLCSPTLLLDLLTWGCSDASWLCRAHERRGARALGPFSSGGGKGGVSLHSVIPHIVFHQGRVLAPTCALGSVGRRPCRVLQGVLLGCM